MTDDCGGHEETEAEQLSAPAPPPATEASFAAVFDLIALVADPREARKRLRGYHEALVAVDQAQKQLLSAQTEFETYQTKIRTELEEQAALLERRRVAVHAAEQDLKRGKIVELSGMPRSTARMKSFAAGRR